MGRLVTVVSKRGCRICEDVTESVLSLSTRYGFGVRVLDISDDAALHDKYYLTIPVVLVDGREVFDARDIGRNRKFTERLEPLLSA